jgi:hemolysin-activating ACP:hemolysin acyltransferase
VRSFDDDAVRVISAANRFVSYGCVMALLSATERYKRVPFQQVSTYALTALQHRQARCYFDDSGVLVGAIIWAWVTQPVLQRLANEQSSPPRLHVSEWREGDCFCVLDVVAVSKSLKSVVLDLAADDIGPRRCISWVDSKRPKVRTRRLAVSKREPRPL